ncbi:MAG: hypothetical protein EBR79_00730, partial [Proteobacteria bacterium]|nr:hypothetical protein [Pseudomonadota bacterium]
MSVVAGYSMFSRITTAKDAALASELIAMENALQHYQTDMGTFYLFTLNKKDGDDSSLEDITALWNKEMVKPGFQKNWHGPYVGFESRKHRTYGSWSLFYAQPDRQNYCMTDTDCYIWLSLSNVPEEMWQSLNAYFDEAGGKQPEPPGEDIKQGKVQA